MNYKLKNNTNNSFEVVETATEQVIRSFPMHKEAKEFLRHLNLGGGFDGWTPSFLLKEVQNKKSAA